MKRRDFLIGGSTLLGGALVGCGNIDVVPTPVVRIDVVDLMPDFFRFLDAARELPVEAARRLFLEDVVARHPDVYAGSVLGYEQGALDARIDAWIPTLPSLEPTMRALHADFTTRLSASRDRFLAALPDFDWDGTIYLLGSIDAFNGAGRMVAGRAALLFGLDVVARLQADADLSVLFHHELFHMYQAPAQAMLAEAVWVEGLATYASIALNPGTTDEAALPYSHLHDPADPQLAVPERAVSLAAVMPGLAHELGPMLRARLRSTEADGDPDDYAMFFLGRAAPGLGPRPVRSAYWFVLQLVRRLAAGRSLRELAAIEPATLVDAMERELDAMIAG